MNKFLLIMFVFAGCSIEAAQVFLDLRPRSDGTNIVNGKVMSRLAIKELGVLRKTQLAAGATTVKGLSVGDVLHLQVYDDVELDLKLVARDETPLTGAAFQAVVGNSKFRNAVVIESEAGLQINFQDEASGLVYMVSSADHGVVVKEIDPKAEATTCAGTLVPESVDEENGYDESVSMTSAVMATNDQASTLVDMLVAYDAPAASWANSNGGGITNLAQQCVTKMNNALANNALNASFRFRLVGVIAVDANGDGDLNSTLDAVTDGEGDWAAIKAMRETVGADVVSTMIDTGSAYGTTGLGWSMTYTDTSKMAKFADNAYNVISVRAAAQSHVMTHETGHNMGAGHSDEQASGPGPQSYSYSSGYYFTGSDKTAYHTIMAYNSDGYGGNYTQAPLFSDPDNTWEDVAAGDATHDNARVLANTYAAVSQFRAQKIAMSYDVFFSPESGSLFSDSVEVTLTPGKSGLVIRYTTDGSTPTATYGLVYSTALTLTETTTIKAVTITDGVAGPVYEATYYLSDLGSALNAPHLVWQTSSDYPWTVETDDTCDGLAVQSTDGGGYRNQASWISTTITGPTKMSFRYMTHCYAGYAYLAVTSDGVELFKTTNSTSPDWYCAEVDIPSGQHTVKFNFQLTGGRTSGFNGAWLDEVRFDALSRPPVMSPTSSTQESTATTFCESMDLTLTASVEGGKVFYTLDGSDPAGDGGVEYTKPITLTKSTLVRAVEVDAGKDASAEIQGLFLERHTVTAGEWTADIEGVKTEALKNGKLICVLISSYDTCPWCREFHPIAKSYSFCNWAKENGVYLVMADPTIDIDYAKAQSYFWTLRSSYGESGSVSYTTMYFALADAPNVAVAKGVGMDYNGQYSIGSVTYDGTFETLAAGVASILTDQGFTPTEFSPASPENILGTTGISWSNNSSTPWRELYPNQMKAGGLMNANFTSTLTATVTGRGKFIFSYLDRSATSSNVNSFSWTGGDGFSHSGYTYDYNSGTITNEVTSSHGATFTFTCKIGNYSYDYDNDYTKPCGFTIYDVKWIPEGADAVERDDGKGNAITIPLSWFEENGLISSGATAEQLSAAADADSDGDGMSNWTEYVCGTDPNDADEKLECTISIVDGVVNVDYSPKSGYISGYKAVLKGKASLSDAEWTEKTSAHKFFRVFIEK